MSVNLLRLPEVKGRVRLGRSMIYLMISRGEFPKPIKLGLRSVAWIESEVDAWIETKIDKNLAEPHDKQVFPVSTTISTDIKFDLRKITSLEDISGIRNMVGIYCLCQDNEVIYVGQSRSAAVRIQSHVRTKTFSRVLFRRCPEADLDRNEGALIRALKPRLNFRSDGYLCAPPEVDDAAALAEIFAC